jgi:hypothetical protein
MAKLVEQYTADFSLGMFDSVAPARYPSAAAAYVENARIEPDGTLRRRPGSRRLNGAPILSSVDAWGCVEFVTAAGQQQIVAFIGTYCYVSTDQGLTWTQKASGLTEAFYDFATMRVGASMYLFAANGDTTIKSWDGTTFSTVSNAPSGVRYVAVFNSRLIAAGHNGVFVQGSKVGDPDTWASPNGWTVQVQTHGGETPTGLFQIGQHLLVFDRKSTSYIDGYGEQTLLVAEGARGFSRSVGCVAFRSIQAVGDAGVMWLSERGIEYYQPGEAIRLQSRSCEEFMGTIDREDLQSQPGRPDSCYDSENQNYHLAISTSGQRNNRIVVVNVRENVAYQREGNPAAITVDNLWGAGSQQTLFGGDTDGYLKLDATGHGIRKDYQGYARATEVGEDGDPIVADGNGYLEQTFVNTLPACLYTLSTTHSPTEIYSLGADCYVRSHAEGLHKDDMNHDETGGNNITMIVISRPFLMRSVKRKKHARVIHIASLQESNATVYARVRGGGTMSTLRTLTMRGLGLDDADRRFARTTLKADAPQVEMRTTDEIRLMMLGLSAEVLREPV